METKAAILYQTGSPLRIEDIEIPALKPGQVLVDIAYSGVCHTQILEVEGRRGKDAYLPHCLGHEGSGIVSRIGPEVKKVKPGDRVILSWIKGSGADVSSTVYRGAGNNINAGSITTFSKQSVISENRITAIPKDSAITLKEAALIGCAVPTGLGAVFNVARPKKGQSIAVFGSGGIGLCAVAGARIAGCNPIISIDIADNKLEFARKMGATDFINASGRNPVDAIKDICPKGLDFAIETVGNTSVMSQCLLSVKNQGGKAVIVGNAPYGQLLELDPRQLNQGKSLLGTWGGDNSPDEDFLKYIELISAGKLDFGPFITDAYDLDDINSALRDLKSGKILRPMISMGLE